MYRVSTLCPSPTKSALNRLSPLNQFESTDTREQFCDGLGEIIQEQFFLEEINNMTSIKNPVASAQIEVSDDTSLMNNKKIRKKS